VPPSRAEGARWVERAAEAGHVEAQSALAALYLSGIGADPAKAAAFAQPQAALFATGESGAPDFERALVWARKAADAGSADGQALMAYIMTSGPGLPQVLGSCGDGHWWA
jgi:TPR repeat protein